ncbi:hypothetical protein BDR06DRAFT_471828 [Suillus hirtellus]|nr:hypothetical protein BDR06DRAFT_471828 [Suillus hirtellus]
MDTRSFKHLLRSSAQVCDRCYIHLPIRKDYTDSGCGTHLTMRCTPFPPSRLRVIGQRLSPGWTDLFSKELPVHIDQSTGHIMGAIILPYQNTYPSNVYILLKFSNSVSHDLSIDIWSLRDIHAIHQIHRCIFCGNGILQTGAMSSGILFAKAISYNRIPRHEFPRLHE